MLSRCDLGHTQTRAYTMCFFTGTVSEVLVFLVEARDRCSPGAGDAERGVHSVVGIVRLGLWLSKELFEGRAS
eukprot:5061067-Amphidinium_carterae.1